MRPSIVPIVLAGLIAGQAQAAVEVRALPIGAQTIVIDGLDGYSGGSIGVRASMPVSLFYGAYAPGGPAIGGNDIAGQLTIAFTISPAALRQYYPTLDPQIRYFNTREGAAFAGLLEDSRVTISMFSQQAGRDVTLLDIASTAPTANFGIFDFATFHTDGRGLKLAHQFGASEQHYGFLQAGDCHDAGCRNRTADDFTLASEILDLGRTIQPGSFRGYYMFFGDADAGFTANAGDPFTIPFLSFNFSSAVPEPRSWALLVIGFGLVGATLRRRRRAFS